MFSPAQIFTLAGFIVLQLVFDITERWCKSHRESVRRAKHSTFLIWVVHPTVIGGFHDWGIYLVSEAHILFATYSH